MAKLKLFSFWRSSASWRVRIALALKRVEYEYVAVDLVAGEQSGEDYTAKSPTRQVPCLEVDGLAHIESSVIVELLEALYPEPALFPAEPHAAARVRALMQIVNAGIQPLQNLRLLGRATHDPALRESWIRMLGFEDHLLPRGFAALERALERLRRIGIGGPHAYGPSVTAADIFIVPQVLSARRFGVDVSPYPLLSAVANAANELPAFVAAAPERQPDARAG